MRTKLVLIFLLFFILNGCTYRLPVETKILNFEPLSIDTFEVPDSTTVNTSFSIRLIGYLQDASWSLHHIDLIAGDFNLEIHPIAQQEETEEVFARITVPFDRNIFYTPTQTGKLLVKVIGYNQTLTDSVRVLPGTIAS